jgi:tetratricopeptide (TPR) repeat protein
LLIAALLVVTVLLVYLPALSGGFVWDDEGHVTRPDLRTVGGLVRIWTEPGATQQYYPLLHSGFWLQWRLWGEHALGYHLVNVLLHALNALLVWLILRRLELPGALLAAFLFALHPVHVESVAWIAELKNTLSGAFCLGAALAYLRFDPSLGGAPEHVPRRWGWYIAALGLFVAGLLSKTVTATLPAALLVIHWWKTGRLDLRRTLLPLLPMFILGAAMGLYTAWHEEHLIGAKGEAFELSFAQRILIAGRAPWFYLGKLLWPRELVFIYERWTPDPRNWTQWLYPVAAVALVLALWLLRRRISRGPLAAVLLFGGMLFPVLGFFNVYPFLFSFVADHFQYLASIGILALLAACFTRIGRRLFARQSWIGAAVAGLVLAALGVRSMVQAAIYRDVETLWRHTLAHNDGAFIACNNLGVYLASRERFGEAVDLYRRAIELRPRNSELHSNLANALSAGGDHEQAERELRHAIELSPDFAEAHANLAAVLVRQGNYEQAIDAARHAIALKPTYVDSYFNLSAAYGHLGRWREAEETCRAALAINPRHADTHFHLGVILQEQGRLTEAAAAYENAAKLRGEFIQALVNLALVRANLGDPRGAAAAARQAIEAARAAGNQSLADSLTQKLLAAP